MFFSNLDESSNSNRVFLFYCIYTLFYHFLILNWLYFMDHFQFLGKSSFCWLLIFIIFVEFLKYSIANAYIFKREPGLGERQKKPSNNSKNRFREFTRWGFVLTSGSVGYFVFAILFGAGLFEDHEETFMLSALMTCLTLWPALVHFGSNGALGMLVGMKPSSADHLGLADLLLGSIQLCIMGAWLGAFVIPLDWDRPWQRWPVPCSTGALLGHAAAHLLCLATLLPRIFGSKGVIHGRPGKKIK